MSIYDYTVKARKGQTLDMNTMKGKVMLIVNTATGCGFTPQYDALQDIYDGLVEAEATYADADNEIRQEYVMAMKG